MTSPSARGPLDETFRPYCATVPCAKTKTHAHNAQPSHVTATTALRYKERRRGEENPMQVNDKAPDFTTVDENGKEVSLKDFRGKAVVLFFYPKADTPGCTKEACGFRDAYKQIQKTGAVVLGISADSSDKQKKFQDKYDLPYTLLADTDKKICNAFGVIKDKNMYGKIFKGIARTTFVIAPDGKIQHIFNNVKAEGHADEVLAYLKSQK
jgi:peroxiredoxin Q/BCP